MINFFRKKANSFYLFNKYPVTKQFVKFALVGSSNMVVDFVVYLFLTRNLHMYYIVAAVMSFVVAVTWSFFLNRKWTFSHNGKNTTSQYIKFFAVNTIVMVLNLSSLFILVDLFNIYDLVAKLIAAVFLAILNFSLNKVWTFRK
ncbi:GtrA family protein [Candidatus Falkowbacteria bacterium]|uniref:GtrA family protein n=1 Tax=Candidatus Buchananbacteria bacterium CG10_big_fil_rev_8_21_14_0_10_33_19 TaxID=1974525 RepID=A0A2H0W3B7_9BACT|nr:GtrA family protein [Candidatus Falkowbacteria bacterium]PIS05849.1 MAG: GtrA family protein [Candidatus Buchananbacteria bacterium CG10_big_fil_rev_8_21_14_0_10_33_19]